MIISNRLGDIFKPPSFQKSLRRIAPLCMYRLLRSWKLSVINFVDYNLFWRSVEATKESSWSRFYKKKHECCYNVDFTRGRKALCDTRCNTFLRSVLLCAYTDYYDHCDYYDDGNFFHNSPLLHSLVSTMQLWCYYIIDTIVWLSPFFFVPVLRWYTFTRTQIYTHMQKTPQINAIDSKQSICTTPTALMFNTFTSKAFLFLLLFDAFYIRDAVEIIK